jgi:hypothetical protein
MRIAAVIGAVAMGVAVLGGSAQAAPAAPAARHVIVYKYGNFRTPQHEPSILYMDGGKDQVLRMTWSSWTSAKAVTRHATFKTCGRACVNQAATVTLTRVGSHASRYYFWDMKVRIPRAAETYWWYYGKPRGARVPMWYQPFCSLHGGTC